MTQQQRRQVLRRLLRDRRLGIVGVILGLLALVISLWPRALEDDDMIKDLKRAADEHGQVIETLDVHEALAEVLGTAVVALGVHWEDETGQGTRWIGTGFLVQEHERLEGVTAGHVVLHLVDLYNDFQSRDMHPAIVVGTAEGRVAEVLFLRVESELLSPPRGSDAARCRPRRVPFE